MRPKGGEGDDRAAIAFATIGGMGTMEIETGNR